MNLKTLNVSQNGSLIRVTFNRPKIMNALCETMIQEVTDVFSQLTNDKSIRVIILEGKGKAFSAGADLNYMKASGRLSFEENKTQAIKLDKMYHAIESCHKPVIAKSHGYAIGGGFGFLVLADISIAETNTKFSLSEVKLGINPSVIGPYCIKKIGVSHYKALGITGETIDTERALRIGLIHEVAGKPELEDVVIKKANQLLKAGPNAIADFKVNFENMDADKAADQIAKLRSGEEGQEGLSAFLEKRPPNWIESIN